ncbi:cytochrome b561 [Sinobacterium caligoides]|uniref:Cytochrome b561 n=1 Tax=Sinobacterium caligoides TaxID=933926 RepID=A0A3N2DNN0_9GAMM|nr:cytochrome b [Sinobacterium caligoides]ROS01269.1 cytochrome b561 [Sinobacterium caligoides]
MGWKNTSERWGAVSIFMHWSVAIIVFALFALGWWMTDLTYYDSWYQQAPFIHKSVGLLVFLLLLLRLLWRWQDPVPLAMVSQPRWELLAARLVHFLLYVLLLVIVISGYLISTADGRSISVFGWLEVPATLQQLPGQEDVAGAVHWYSACSLMFLVLLHSMAALKHQFINKDGTLSRMLRLTNKHNRE